MTSEQAWTPSAFEARLRAPGDYYHINHPFQVAMHEGKLIREQIQVWAVNKAENK